MTTTAQKNKKSEITAVQISEALIEMSARTDISLTHLKLQKLVYFVHGWSLGWTGKPAVEDGEEPLAWRYGPVWLTVYDKFKEHGNKEIPSHLGSKLPPDQKLLNRIIELVWDYYANRKESLLVGVTHVAGSPWDTAEKKKSLKISDEWTKDYYKKLA